MNFRVISRNVGFALLVSALFMFLSILVSVANGNDSALAALMISFTITFIVGVFPFIFVRKNAAITLKDGYIIIFLSWLLSFIFGMLPYALWGGPFTVVNALFESVSGFTTTGGTILSDVESLPNSLLFWRSSTHFIGGLGVVVFLLLVIPNSSPVRLRLANMELSSLSREGYRSRANKTVIIFTSVYLGICILAFLSYCLAGMSAFDAINHAFSVCATGGFSTRNQSIGSFHSDLINLITMVFMLLASIHFALIFMAVVTRSLKPFKNPVLKFYLGTLAICSIITALYLKIGQIEPSWYRAFMDGTFQILSYATADNSAWPLFPCLLMMYVGVQCGMAGSTTGGLKSDRVMMLFKAIGRQLRRNIHPASVSEIKLGNRIVRDEELYPHILYIAMYGMLLVVSVLVCIGEIGTFGNYGAEPAVAKVIYCLDMFLGRVEIYPVLAACGMIFSRAKR